MTASYKGDTVFKLRVGCLNDPANPSVIFEQVQPDFYFPTIDPMNVSAQPTQEEISSIVQVNGNDYLRKEIHSPGKIVNELWKMKGAEIISKEPLTLLGDAGLKDEEDTGVDRILLFHVPKLEGRPQLLW
jgi:hypothetical protein